MPVSLLLEDALKSFGIQPGRHRIVSSEWMVHRFQSKDGKEHEPFVALAIGYLPIDEKGNATGEAEIDYSLKVGPAFGETIDKAKFAPASTVGQPLPLRIGSKGLYLEPTGDQKQLSEKSKVMLYLKELYKCGFDAKRLAASNFNVGLLVGTEGDIFELVSQNDGTDEKTGEKFKATKIPAFNKIYKYGYEVQGTPASAAATAAAPAQVVNGVAAGAANVVDASGLAVTILAKIAANSKEKKVEKLPKEQVVKLVLSTAARMDPRPDSAQRDAAKALIASDDFYEKDEVLSIAVLSGDVVEWA